MICNNNYFAYILRVCEIKDLIWVMRFQSPLVYQGFDRDLLLGNFYRSKLSSADTRRVVVSF